MPELPEVESVKRKLESLLKGHTLEKVEVKSKSVINGPLNKLEGGKFKCARRFGKVTVLDFSNGYSVVVHVKLTGQLIYRGPNLKSPPKLSPKVTGGLGGKHTHVIFHLDKGGTLYYNDVRKFGWIKVVKTSEVPEIDFIKKLGPEPLDGLTRKKFKEIVSSSRSYIKTLLMDQKKIGGVGNIYANDALFLARILPTRKANTLKDEEIAKLYDAIETVLRRGLKYEGASELAFVMPDGTEGEYQKHTLVYGKQGTPCPNGCGGKIIKNFLSGRGTYFCPKCQK